MLLRSHITSLKKLASGLSYLVALLCISAFAGHAGHTPALPEDPVSIEIVFSAGQQAYKTISWQRAVSIFEGSKHSVESSKVNFVQLSRFHDRLSKTLYDYLYTQFIISLTLECIVPLKVLPQSSDELPASLFIA